MDHTTHKIAKRIVVEILDIANKRVDLRMFQGLGIALAIVFEESTGQSARNITPTELIKWAMELPEIQLD